jgi:hypothetical protein
MDGSMLIPFGVLFEDKIGLLNTWVKWFYRVVLIGLFGQGEDYYIVIVCFPDWSDDISGFRQTTAGELLFLLSITKCAMVFTPIWVRLLIIEFLLNRIVMEDRQSRPDVNRQTPLVFFARGKENGTVRVTGVWVRFVIFNYARDDSVLARSQTPSVSPVRVKKNGGGWC